MKMVVATHNQGKVREIADLLARLKLDWLSLDDVGIDSDVEETGESFEENASLKARHYARLSGMLTLADDSGLEVDALGGEPGVRTARFGGPGLSPRERYELLLRRLAAVPEPQRTARFRCAVALASPDELLGVATGVVEGSIATTPAGDGGFGYDPVFLLPDYGQTMAELPAAVKQELSHRARAIRAMTPLLRRLAGEDAD
jgi:XTP/dITP diphosphohydrolase